MTPEAISMEAKLKHLEFILSTIERMATHSFTVKGWSVTLVSALFALAAKDANIRFVLIAYLPILMFWGLDAFFLHQEKLFRALYNAVRVLPEAAIDFSMDTRPHRAAVDPWNKVLTSTTLLSFHGCLVAVTLIAMAALLVK